MQKSLHPVMLAHVLKRLKYILTITHDIRVAGEIHMSIDEITEILNDLLEERN